MLPHQDGLNEDLYVRTVKLAQAGNSEAFANLFHQIEPAIYGYLVGLVGNNEEARDLTQEIALKIWQKLASLQDSSRFRPWAFTIARNLAYDHLRAKRRQTRRTLSQSWEELEENDTSVIVPDSERSMEEAELINLALKELPVKHRDCLMLLVIGGFSLTEIAELLGIRKESVSVYVSVARRQFREALNRLSK